MNSSISQPGSAFSRRRIAGVALAAALWAPVYTPGMMLWSNISSRLVGIQQSSLGFTLYISFFVILSIYWLGPALAEWLGAKVQRPFLFDVDKIMTDDGLTIGEKFEAVRATSLGRFLMIYACLFVGLVGLSLAV